VKIKSKYFWLWRYLRLYHEVRGSKVLRNVSILPQHYTTSQSRRLRLERSRVSDTKWPTAFRTQKKLKLISMSIDNHWTDLAENEKKFRTIASYL